MNKIRTFLLALAAAGMLAACDNSGSNNSNQAPQTPPATQASKTPEAQPPQSGTPGVTQSTKGEISLAKNFYFVFDGSGSMQGRRIAEAKQAVHAFMKTVPEGVNLGLFVFDWYGTREVVPLGPNNRRQFLKAIDDVSASGGTPLGASIETAVKALALQYEKQLGYGEFRLIVVTDGESGDSIGYGVGEAAKNRIPIYTIGIDMQRTHELAKHSVSYRAANSQAELEKALEQAASELDVFDPEDFPGEKK